MRLFSHKIFSHRKIILVFILAIFLPSLIVGYLSLSTFSKRREAVKNLLESNLWISGESALKSVEESLLVYEQKVLKPENFSLLIRSGSSEFNDAGNPSKSQHIAGSLFLLDADFKIVMPETGSENGPGILSELEIQNDRFTQFFGQAEILEFSQKNYTRAAESYKDCKIVAPTGQLRAYAMEGLGRCLLFTQKFREAEEVYSELFKDYGNFLNKAGHPYGIIALFQQYEIACNRKEEEMSLKILLELYRKIINGTWPISKSVYDFYTEEIESIFQSKLSTGKFSEIQKSVSEILKEPSPYEKTMLFRDFLQRNAVPLLKEKIALSGSTGESMPGRFLITQGKEFFLVSYTILPGLRSGQTCYGGFCWDNNLLKKNIIQNVLDGLTKESALSFNVADEKNQNFVSGDGENLSKLPLQMTFRTFPLPWKLLVSHPEINAIEKAARREIFFYGILLSVIIVLMLLGAFLIARDITRESETSQLKTEFVNNISHELKTPLTLIRLYGETLQRKKNLTTGEREECYEIITKESERLSHLINNVLDFSRIETGRKEFNFKSGYLQDVISDTLESYRYHLEKKGFAIRSDIAGDLPEMNFDGEAIASLLINLLSNAMKFSQKEKEVTVKLFRDNGNVVLQVTDKGIGIKPEEVPKIFLRFYRAQNKAVTETRGSGLGLTLVKHITEAHNGKIEVVSEPGKGSIFSIKLPVMNSEIIQQNEKTDTDN